MTTPTATVTRQPNPVKRKRLDTLVDTLVNRILVRREAERQAAASADKAGSRA